MLNFKPTFNYKPRMRQGGFGNVDFSPSTPEAALVPRAPLAGKYANVANQIGVLASIYQSPLYDANTKQKALLNLQTMNNNTWGQNEVLFN